MNSETRSLDDFPMFERVRRFYGIDHPFFKEGEVHREIQANRIGPGHIDELIKEAVGELDIPVHFTLRPFCSVCKQTLPTEHLLNLHLAESHDSFFAVQAARKMPVFECLVESCEEKFTSREHRENHLFQHHRFPQGYNYENLHRPSKRSRMLLDARPRKPRKNRQEQRRNKKERKNQTQNDSLSSTKIEKKGNNSDLNPDAMEVRAIPEVQGASAPSEGMVDGSNEMEVDKVTVAFSRLRTAETRMPLAPRFGHRRGGSMMMPRVPVATKDGQFQRQHLPVRPSNESAATSGNVTKSAMDCDSTSG